MSKSIRRCIKCNSQYDHGFFGTGYKYCSKKCRMERNRVAYAGRYLKRKNTSCCCMLCRRNIFSVGQKKNVSKYCSRRCLEMATRIRKGQTHFYAKIPVTVVKLVKFSVDDIPKIWGYDNSSDPCYRSE